MKTCLTCKKKFSFVRRNAQFCSVLCYRRSPDQKRKSRNYSQLSSSKASKLFYWNSSRGRAGFRLAANKTSLYSAIKTLTGKATVYGDVKSVYNCLVQAVVENSDKARRLFKAGGPDVIKYNTEFKVGIDCLRPNQLILSILKRRKTKIRWFPSTDAIEEKFRNEKDRSVLYESHIAYLLACEASKGFDLKVSA